MSKLQIDVCLLVFVISSNLFAYYNLPNINIDSGLYAHVTIYQPIVLEGFLTTKRIIIIEDSQSYTWFQVYRHCHPSVV